VPYYPGLRDVRTVQAEYEYQPAQRQMPTLKEKTYHLTVTFLPSRDGQNQLWLDTDLGSYPPRWGLSEPASRVRTSSDKHSLVEALSEVTGDQFSGGCGQFDPNRAAIDQALAWLVPGGRLDSNLYGDVLLSYSGESPLPPEVRLIGRGQRYGYPTETYEKSLRDGVVRVTTSPVYPLVFHSCFRRHDGRGKDVTLNLLRLRH